MAFVIKDRVKEITTSVGTGAVSLGTSSATFDTFQSCMTNGDTTYYAIVHTASGVDEWEVGLGTFNTNNTLSRTTVLAGSSGTSTVNFSAGAKDVFMTYPAAQAALKGYDVNFADITVTGTVDGRDVAVDGAKLDGIEASADVTDIANVTAAGALMDSEVTNLAQVKAFNSSDYATAAQGTTADAALPKSGGAMTGTITTNSTFDGRDVSVDGDKLDGIEALADVTGTANVAAAGALMDSEVDADIKTLVLPASTTISTFGASLVDDADAATARTTLGLGTIETNADVTDTANVTAAGALMDSEVTNLAQVKAFDSTDYATSAQGDTADNAVQPADLATVATTGAYSNLSGLPTLGTAAATASTDYATAAQGNTADTALQNITGQSIEDLSDVASMTPSTNQVLSWNGTAWTAATVSSGSSYADSDVDAHLNFSTATSGQILSYNGSDYDWIAAGGGGGIEFTVKTTTYTASTNEGIIADTAGGVWTLTLPASPSAGDVVVIADGADWATNNLTVGRNGSTIESAAEDLTMDIGNVSVTLIYNGSTWQVYVQAGASEPSVFTASSTDTLTNKTISGANNTLTVDGTNSVGYLKLPPVGTKTTSYTLQTADVGKYVQVGTGGSITVPDATFAEGDAISLFNNTTGDITITCSVTTAYIAGADADVASVTLATRGVANVLFISGTVCVITGNIS
ncbi:hypothetical protein OAD41_00135 [bacterium]|nr:hypothetical protein [bacterium]